jgi:diguanylate cyclase (GGDEF)-like protein/PAS domain S-box-containing protein
MKTDTAKTASALNQSFYIKVKKTGFFASLLLIPIWILIIAANFWLSDKAEEDRGRVVHTHEVETSLFQVILALKDAETGQREFLLTQDKAYLDPYTNSIARINELLITLQLLTSDNISQQDRLIQINSLVEKKLNELDKTITLVATQDRSAAIDIVISNKGKKLMSQLIDLIDKMASEEAMLLMVREQDLAKTNTLVTFIQAIGFTTLFLVGIITFLNIKRLLLEQLSADEQLVIINQELALQNEEKDKRANELTLAASVFSHAREGILITDAATTIIDVNDKFTEITGYSREDAIGQTAHFLFANMHPPEFYAEMWCKINSTKRWIGEIFSCRKNGEKYLSKITISAVKNDVGDISHYVSLFSDITEQHEHQHQLEKMAHYDALTNLPNRALLADRLNQAMLQCKRQDIALAVIFMDLDGFKHINDTYGHAIGDELLIKVSHRMKGVLRQVDTLARIGGDEFVVVLTNLSQNENYKYTLERLLHAVSEPIVIDDVALNISVSIGVTLYPEDCADADILVRHADQAMYLAKQAGKNRYHLFDSAHDDAVNIMQGSIDNIRDSFSRREFVLYYQPKVNMSTGDVVGAEALIRWQHPERGLVSPFDFLPIIENHVISLDIGEWVIDTALSQISQWQTMGITHPISVNISAYQLQQADFVEHLAALLVAHPDVSPHLLELEVLETSAFSDIDHIIATMQSCIALGVKFSLDDFGTGYSSLTYLKRLPASEIKIDQSFIQHMLTDADDLAIVRGVISLAKAFRLNVIAEGVETTDHGIALLQMGCELAQGYGIARPMPASDLPAWIKDWKPDVAWLS